MSPRTRHGESGQFGSGASTPVQIAPLVPSMMPNGSSAATRPSSPTLIFMQGLEDLNDKMNYVKAQQGLRHVRQQGEHGPVTMASLHKMRANKEAIYKAEIEAYKKVLENKNVTGSGHKAITNGPCIAPSSGSAITQSAEVLALQIVTKQLQQDHRTVAAQLKQLNDDKTLQEAQMEKSMQQRIDTAVQQQLQQKVQEAVRDQLKSLLDTNVKTAIDQLLEEKSKDMAAEFRQQSSVVSLEVQSLSSDVSALQTKLAVETDLHKTISDQVAKIDVAHINTENELLSQLKALDQRCNKFLRFDSSEITSLSTKVNNQKQDLDKLMKEIAAGNSQSRIFQSQIEDHISTAIGPITRRLDAFEPSVDEKLEHVTKIAEKTTDKQVRQAESILKNRIDTLEEQNQNLQEKVDRATQDVDADKKARDIAIKGVREEFSKKLASLDSRISTTDKGQDKSVRKDLLRELSALRERLSGIESSHDTTVRKVKQLSSQTREKSVQNDLTNLEKRVGVVESSQDKTVRVDLEKEISKLKGRMPSPGKPSTTLQLSDNFVEKVSNIEARMATLENGSPSQVSTQFQTLKDFVEGLNSGLEEVELAIHGCKTDINALKIDLPQMFANNLLPFQTRTNEQIQKINDTISHHEEFIGKLGSTVSSQGDGLERLVITVSSHKDDLGKLSATISSQGDDLRKLVTTVSSQGDVLGKLVATVSSQEDGLGNLVATVSSKEDDLGRLVATVSSQGDDLQKLQTTQLSYEDKIRALQTVQYAHDGELSKLQNAQLHTQAQQARQDLSSRNSPRVNSPSFTGFESQIKTLSAEVQKMRQEVNNKISTSDTEAIQKLHGQLDIIKHAYQSLEHRYENINTAELHGMMVQQLQQMYPSAPAFLDQLRVNQAQVQDLVQRIHKIEEHFHADSGGSHSARESIQNMTGTLRMIENSITGLQGEVQALQVIGSEVTALQSNVHALERKFQANPFKSSYNNESAYQDIQSTLEKEVNDRKQAVAALRSDLTTIENKIYVTRHNLDKRIDEGQKETIEVAKRVDRVVDDNVELQERIGRVGEETNQVNSRVVRAEEDISKHAKRIESLDMDTGALDKRFLQAEVHAKDISRRFANEEAFSSDVKKRLPDLDELIGWKDRIIDGAGACPIIVAKQLILTEFLETLNDNLGVPVQHMNLDQLKTNPFERKSSG
jgi:chromosome segregation ATPase